MGTTRIESSTRHGEARDPVRGRKEIARHAAMLQSVPRKVVAMSIFTPDTSTSSRHSHGRGQFLLGNRGTIATLTERGSFILPPQHGLWIPPGAVHQSRSWTDVEVVTLYVDPLAISGYPDCCRLVRTSALLRALIDEVLSMPTLYDEDGRDGALVDLLLQEILRMPSASLHVAIPAEVRLRHVCEAFLADTGSNRSLDEWAASAGMSRRTFTRLFRREADLSFSRWQLRVRLLEALARLGAGEPVTRVAMDVGYDSPSAFAAMFKRELGTKPKTYFKWTDDGPGPAGSIRRASSFD